QAAALLQRSATITNCRTVGGKKAREVVLLELISGYLKLRCFERGVLCATFAFMIYCFYISLSGLHLQNLSS
ncbi:hypothetical protein LJC27_01335, partial [Christensenellaceae bacterium OttesenSCG-928-M15]|nr:hypothetical protein [Christensenellaceae bacterium OttesenSCG-928-M15]